MIYFKKQICLTMSNSKTIRVPKAKSKSGHACIENLHHSSSRSQSRRRKRQRTGNGSCRQILHDSIRWRRMITLCSSDLFYLSDVSIIYFQEQIFLIMSKPRVRRNMRKDKAKSGHAFIWNLHQSSSGSHGCRSSGQRASN